MSTSGHLKFQGTNRATFVGTTSNIMFDTTTTSLGIGVTGTDHPSSNLYITGNAYVSSNIAVGGVLTMGTVNVVARHDLEAVSATGNTTPLTLEFTNPTTGIVASGNVEVGGNVVAGYLYGDGSNISGISSNLDQIVNNGNVTSNTVQFSNAITSLTATSNIEVAGFVGSSGTGALTLPSGTTADKPTGVAGMIRFNETIGMLEFYMGTAWETIGRGYVPAATQSAGSGATTISGVYKIHTFTSVGTLTVTTRGEIEYLIVAGGGAGATTDGGGGGAGGVVYGTMTIETGAYGITIGAGGAFVDINDRAGLSGSNSTALGFTAIGGGGGGVDRYGNSGTQGPKSGGSGGGGGSRQGTASTSTYWGGASSTQNSTGSTGYGNNGGDGVGEATVGYASTRHGGGGGGAGEAGKDGNDSSDPGGGGDGIEWPSASGTYYGGGGGGGHNQAGQGGQGGGGEGSNGGSFQPPLSRTGAVNTGGGGGGGGQGHTRGGNGGSGIVIIRYRA